MTLALGPGAYRIVPSEKMREWGQQARQLLSGNRSSDTFADADEFHQYTIEDGNGRPVLELVRKRVPLEDGEGGFIDDLLLGGDEGLRQSVKDIYLFRPPGDDPVFTLDIPRGLEFDYTLTDNETEDVLATWEKSMWMFGNWHLKTPRKGHVATVKWSRWVRELNPFRRQGTYVLYGVDGSELGEFRRVGFEGESLAERALTQLEVRLSTSSISTEVGLAFAFGMLFEAGKSRDTHT